MASQMYLAQLTVRKPGSAERHLGSYNMYVSPDFFRTRRAAMFAGRDFSEADTGSSLPVAIVSKTLAEMLFPGMNPVGMRFREDDNKGKGQDYYVEVIGVTADMQYRRPDLAPLPILFRPVAQCASCLAMGELRSTRCRCVAGDGKTLGKRGECRSSCGAEFSSAEQHIQRRREAKPREAWMAMFFGLFGGLLAMIGVYGVTSYATSQRTREIGIRMTLGAQPGDVFRMILRETIIVVFIGVALGVAAGFDGAKTIQGMLWGVSASDPLTFVLAGCVMLLMAGVAAFLPARRASKADPIIALRFE